MNSLAPVGLRTTELCRPKLHELLVCNSSCTTRRIFGQVVSVHRKLDEDARSRGRQQAENTERAKVVIITGPTAVGKSSVAVELAERLGGEIVSADSVQIFRGMDVGSAKTSKEEQKGVRHHLMDIMSPEEMYDYGPGMFFDDARKATEEVLQRGKLPIVVGGSCRYVSWYMSGRPSMSQVLARLRVQAAKLHRHGRWDKAVQLLAQAQGDAATAFMLCRNDWGNLFRGFEILRAVAQPHVPHSLSSGYIPGISKELDYDFRCFFLHRPRGQLFDIMDARCEEMVANTSGLLQESAHLLDLGLEPYSNPATQAIGYREAMDYLGRCRVAKGRSTQSQLLEFLDSFQRATREFGKKQLTWFRNDPIFRWLNVEQRTLDDLVSIIANDLVNPEAPSMCFSSENSKATDIVEHQTKLTVFHSPAECSKVINWIQATQNWY